MCPRFAALFAAPIGAAVLLASPPADACGGFFCSNVPVVQSGEQIIFAVDEEAGTVDAIIQINYSGSAEDFAWVLPLQSAPERMGVATSRLFATTDRLTAPQFRARFEANGPCSPFQNGTADAASFSDAGAPGGGGVTVLVEAKVGPYESIVVEGSDPEEIRGWLVERGYRVTEEMMLSVVPYIAQGDALLALRLKNDSTAGDLQPIALTLRAAEACIPIRMTAIAAQDDMEITAMVLSRRGRAVPANYLHFTPNLARVNWMRGGNNYRSLVGDAADEAGGNAFTTEFAGSTSIFRNAIYFEGEYSLSTIRAATTLEDVLNQIGFQQLGRRAEMRAILQRHITDELISSTGVDPARFWQCPSCFPGTFTEVPFDPGPLADEIDERILTPDREAQALFDDFGYLTRMFTLISPEEMTIDPEFDFRQDLPDVDNVHEARVVTQCRADGTREDNVRVELEDGRVFYTDLNGNLKLGLSETIPASDIIEHLVTGEIVQDNRKGTDEQLQTQGRSRASCGCDTGVPRESWAGLLGISILLAGLLAARKRL